MRIPFSAAFSIGTDIICVRRIAALHASGPVKLQKFAQRLLQHRELVDLDNRFPGWQPSKSGALTGQQKRAIAWLAGRWAAKEAAKKAWGASIISFRDLRVEVETDGEVAMICASDTTDESQQMEQAAKLSISHDGDYASAVVLAAPLHESIKAELGRRKRDAEENVNMHKEATTPT